MLKSGSVKGPFGAKGIGKRITHLPVTAERVFFALHGGERE